MFPKHDKLFLIVPAQEQLMLYLYFDNKWIFLETIFRQKSSSPESLPKIQDTIYCTCLSIKKMGGQVWYNSK